MCARAVIVLVMLRALALADPPPTIEVALAHAAVAGKPLVVEFGAVWCKPCRDFEDHVLTRPEVKESIATVEYVRYDIDTPPGDAAARRYGVTSVPAFIILAADGSAIERHVGAGDGARWFLGLLARSRARTASSSELERAVDEHPDRIPERLRLAGHYRAIGKISEAASQLRAVIDLPNVSRATAATTTAELDDMVTAEARLQATVETALAFVTKFPESPLATPRLAILIATGRVPAAQIADLVHEHLDKVPPSALPDAIRVAMLAGAPTEAKLALSRLAPGYEARLLRAELDLVLHDHEAAAREVISSVCSKLPADFELRCFALEQSIRAGQSPAGVTMLASRASLYVQALETPIAPAAIVSLSELANDELAFGNVLARGLLNARARCADTVSSPTHVFVVAVPAQHSPGRSKMMIQTTKNLERCLHEQLDNIVFPSTTARLENGVYARIDVRSELRNTPAEPPEPIAAPANGAVVFASARVGGVDAAGIGASGLVDITSLAALRVIARAELEVGRGDSATYAARGLFGFAIPGRGAVFGFFGGAGVSRFGDSVPRATEVLWEMTIKVLSKKLQYHFAFRSTHVYDAPMRKDPSGGSDAFGGDEIGVSLGASIPVLRKRVFVGASVEHRALGDTELFVVGVPLGSFY